MRELAVKLGVSHATVSMALRNNPSISEATRLRVQALAREMNYRGNILVSALLSQVRSRKVIGSGEVIAMLSEGAGLQHAPVVAAHWETLQRWAWQIGLKLELFPLGHRGRDSASVGRVLFNRGIRGVIVAPMPLDILPLRLNWDMHAAIAVGYSFRQREMHRVANAHFGGLITCHRELTSAGYERIGCVISHDEDERSLHYWQAAALCAPRVHGGAKVAPLMIKGASDEEAFVKWFQRNRLDAVIGNNPDQSVGWMRKLGLRVPADVGYASLDLASAAKFPGMRQSWPGIFTTAIDQLAGELARNSFGPPETPRVTLVDGVWRG